MNAQSTENESMGTIIELTPFLAKEYLLDLADLALANNGMGNRNINRRVVRVQLKALSVTQAREHLQGFVNRALEKIYGEYAPELIKPLSHYERELEGYTAFLLSLPVLEPSER